MNVDEISLFVGKVAQHSGFLQISQLPTFL